MKQFYHLPVRTTNQLPHCSKRDGGLDLPVLEDLVRVANPKAFSAPLRSDDPLAEALFRAKEGGEDH